MIGSAAQIVINAAKNGQNVGWGILIGLIILVVGLPIVIYLIWRENRR